MDVNAAIDGFKEVAAAHPYLGLAIILFTIGVLVRGKVSYVFYFLGGLALLQEFSLFGTFVEFLKGIPDQISSLINALGGVLG
ncbi:t26-9p [Thermococcus sp. LS1]|uniref:t26-9p n=1 Tax=Thermococcus sp. LS1 TaxID=1638259 RepID=UPI00143A89C7|nr:t26-9p [Thermococcus sp. LS1]NJD99523.1 t26-9p [Thermococcus sp. LS1]